MAAAVKTAVDAKGLAETLGLIGGSARFRILALVDGEKNVGTISRELGLSLSGASQHLGKLRAYGLVIAERHDQEICYRRNEEKIVAALETAIKMLTK